MNVGYDGTITVTEGSSGDLPTRWEQSDTTIFKLNDLDACAVTVEYPAVFGEDNWGVVLHGYLKRNAFQTTYSPSTYHRENPSLYWAFRIHIESKESALRIARAFKKAIVLSGAPKDDFGDDCENQDITVHEWWSPPNSHASGASVPTRPVSQPKQSPPTAAPKKSLANATVSLQFIEGKPFLVVTNSSDQDATVGYGADYKDSAGNWCNKLHGRVFVAKHNDFKYELYDALASEWRVQKEGER